MIQERVTDDEHSDLGEREQRGTESCCGIKNTNCERGEGAEVHLCQALSRNPGEVQQLSSETLPQLSLHQLLSLHPVTVEFTE